jgi:endonuclease YncB( thermonuclease family)
MATPLRLPANVSDFTALTHLRRIRRAPQTGRNGSAAREATFALAFERAEQWVTCKGYKRDRYGRLIAVCLVGPYDLNARIVRNGWALAYRRYSMDYVEAESEAKEAKRGSWKGELVPPWEWRKTRKSAEDVSCETSCTTWPESFRACDTSPNAAY